jgi:hypothetical protein
LSGRTILTINLGDPKFMVSAPKIMVKNIDHKPRGPPKFMVLPKVYGNIDQFMVKNIDHKLDLLDHKLRDVPKFTAKILTINLIFLTINFGTARSLRPKHRP